MRPRTSSSGLVVFAILHHVSLALSVIFLAASFIDGPRELWRAFAVIFSIPVAVFGSLILHRGWSAVQDGSAQTTAGKAVGFCYIPFFNLYWTFIAYVGLTKEFNRLAEARGRPDQKVNEGFALTYSILAATVCLSILSGPFAVVFIWQTIGAVKDLENS
jgi:ABC-type Mn2+/Zn2+ transport system permease subunit